ncbi:MAG: hypothetical protein PUB11_06605 [Oscillospiraceae bacterium]|nr:hypothetical protein [Oscillospiraceae bacterium]
MKQLKTDKLNKFDKVLFCAAFMFAFFFMSHPDLWETANHSYIFLESLFGGKILDFYKIVRRHENTYYYINGANYNILVYALFGIREIPIFAFNKIFGLAVNEAVIIYAAKLVSVLFFVLCGFAVKSIARECGLKDSDCSAAALFFLFNPIAFYSPMAMGQYDSICLFFTLWAIVFYMRGDLTKFSLITGAAVCCKFFALLTFIPLLLLSEKKILKIAKYALMSLWLYLPTALLYMGRRGDSGAFTKIMAERMFALTFDTGFKSASVFLTFYAVLVFFAFLYCPAESGRKYTALWLCAAVFGGLFACIYWHPQWLVLLIPFTVLTTFIQKNKMPFFLVDLVLRAGFFLTRYTYYPNQTGATLFAGGVLSHVFGLGMGERWQPLSHFIGLIPYIDEVMPVMFVGGIAVNLIFKFKLGEKSLADILTSAEKYDSLPVKVCGYAIFIIGFVGMWLAPSVLELINSYGII